MKYVQLSLIASVGENAVLPSFLGITLRGAFGFNLKRLVCQVSHGQCRRCVLQTACPYPQVFDGVAPAGRSIMKKYPNVPQPFVLVVAAPSAAETVHPAELRWDVRLFGPAVRFWPYVIHTFQQAGQEGIGQSRTRYDLRSVQDGLTGGVIWSEQTEQAAEPEIGVVPETTGLPERSVLRWSFVTPLRLKEDGCIMAGQISGLALALAARRRHMILDHFYGTGADSPDTTSSETPARLEESDFVTHDVQCHPWTVRRFSMRQRQTMDLDGIIGQATIEGPWSAVGPALAALPVVHLGKATSFGLGRVQWEVV